MPRSAAAGKAPPPSPSAPPPLWRDPWAWAALGAVFPLLARARGAPLGVPFADDFHFLRHAFFGGGWLDGGGAVIYWRPLARQAYFGALGSLMVSHPGAIAALHTALLALASLLLYRVWRRDWPGPAAAAAASFPLLAESSRTLILWPSAFQDLGALLFSAAALWLAGRGRRAASVAALVAALLCKEVALVTALLLPWVPGPGLERRERLRWAGATAIAVAAWGACYWAVMRHAGLLFQRQLESAPPPLGFRSAWALLSSLGDALSLEALRPDVANGFMVAAAVWTAATVAWLVAARRERLRAALPWVVWGTAWFLANTATLTQVYPVWGPFRSGFGMVGLGIALSAMAWAAGPAALALLVALRLAALLASPAPSPRVPLAPYEAGAALDFQSLARLSRLSVETRRALAAGHPELPPGSAVAWFHRPLMAQHAFAHGQALHVWYRDTTLRWVNWEEMKRPQARYLGAVLEFAPAGPRQVVVVDTDAARAYLVAADDLEAEAYDRALEGLARADSLQRDREAHVFLGAVAGKRALCLLSMGEIAAARAEAERSLALSRDASDPRYVLAVLHAVEGRLGEARSQLDSLLARHPFDVSARALLDTLRAQERVR